VSRRVRNYLVTVQRPGHVDRHIGAQLDRDLEPGDLLDLPRLTRAVVVSVTPAGGEGRPDRVLARWIRRSR